VKAELKTLMEKVKSERPGFEYEIIDLFEVMPTMTKKSSKIVQMVGQSIKEILEKEPTYVVSPGTYDQKHIDQIGQLKNCIAYDPGILDLAHQPDEWIEVNDMVQSCQVMSLSIAKVLN
jgi:succinyl-diaminopimelate desuccinylase